MENQTLEIQAIEKVTHNVLRFTLEDSDEIDFHSGQASEVAIDKDGWRDKGRPFTFTSLPEENQLEFTIKIYPDHEGVTNELSKLQPGDHLILKDVFGAIQYKGPGTFIAGGVGVTPFISIIRNLAESKELEGNRLIFANDKEKDIINHEEFHSLLGEDFLNILAEEDKEGYGHGFVDQDYLKKELEAFDEYFYICGPPPMMDAVEKALTDQGVKEEQMITEKFD